MARSSPPTRTSTRSWSPTSTRTERPRRRQRSVAGSRRRSTWALDHADAAIVTASTEAHGRLVLAAIERGLPTFCEKPLAFDLAETVELVDQVEAARRRRPGRLPAPVRSGLPGDAPSHRVRRARDGVPGPPDRPRSRTAARGVHSPLRRALPRFVDPRLRRPSLGDRAGGRRGLRHRVGAWLPGLRAVRRRRHRGGHPDPGGRDPRRPQPDAARPARLRHPDGDRRLARRGDGRARRSRRRSARSSQTRRPWPVRPGSRSSAASSRRIGTS